MKRKPMNKNADKQLYYAERMDPRGFDQTVEAALFTSEAEKPDVMKTSRTGITKSI